MVVMRLWVCDLVVILVIGSCSFWGVVIVAVVIMAVVVSISCPNCSATCSSYSTRNVVRYIKTSVKLTFPYSNPNTGIVLCYG